MELRGKGIKPVSVKGKAPSLRHPAIAPAAAPAATASARKPRPVAPGSRAGPAQGQGQGQGQGRRPTGGPGSGVSLKNTENIKGGNVKAKAKVTLPPMSLAEEAEFLLAASPAAALGPTGSVRVKFSHYSKSFPVHNGVLRWAAVDAEYCLSFVYRGDFTRELHLAPAPPPAPPPASPPAGAVSEASAQAKQRAEETKMRYAVPECKLDWPKAVRDERGAYFLKLLIDR
jgi:hypothetical protein